MRHTGINVLASFPGPHELQLWDAMPAQSQEGPRPWLLLMTCLELWGMCLAVLLMHKRLRHTELLHAAARHVPAIGIWRQVYALSECLQLYGTGKPIHGVRTGAIIPSPLCTHFIPVHAGTPAVISPSTRKHHINTVFLKDHHTLQHMMPC